MSEQTDHERDMERLAVRITQMNNRDAPAAATDSRNADQQGVAR